MPIAPEELGRARRAWLAQHRQRHAERRDADSALALAQANWQCGHYLDALTHFLEARDRAPGQAGFHLAVVRALASLARWSALDEALAMAQQWHPDEPFLALALAQRRLHEDAAGAWAVLARLAGQDPFCQMYAMAIEHLSTGTVPTPRQLGDARLDAAWQGFVWCYGKHGPDGFLGFPSQVLEVALAAAQVPGTVLECGVYFGRSLRFLAEHSGQVVHGFDSFQGLPEAWNENEPAGAYTTAGELPDVPDTAQLHVGWFEDTLPPFFSTRQQPVRLLHVDCDLFSSTRTVLSAAAEALVPGSVLVFDDFVGFPGSQAHEFRAWHEFSEASGLRWTVLASSLLGREVAIRVDAVAGQSR